MHKLQLQNKEAITESRFSYSQSCHKVLISNPHGNNTIKAIVQKMGDNVKAGSIHEAALAQILIVFVIKADLEELVRQLPDMSGKIILHTNNPLFTRNVFHRWKIRNHPVKS